jgi:hypothetical protein
MSLILKIANVIYRIFLSFITLCKTNNTNKITPEEYDMYVHEYVKKHPEIMYEQSKDLQVDN